MATFAAMIEDNLLAMVVEVYREWNRDRAHWVNVDARSVFVAILSKYPVDTITTIRTQ